MKAQSISARTAEEMEAALETCLREHFQPTVALVFSPGFMESEDLQRIFSSRGIALFGSSSFGSFTETECKREIISAMLLDMPPDTFRIIFAEATVADVYQKAFEIANNAKEIFKNPAFVVVLGGIQNDGEAVLKGIKDGAGEKSIIFGGKASSALHFGRTFVYNHEQQSDAGIICLVIDNDKIQVKGLASGGWLPVGTFHTITKSSGNIVYTINDQPALDYIARYSGIDLLNIRKSENPLSFFAENDSLFQLELHREHAGPLMRTPVFGHLEEKFVVFAGSIPEGSKVIFSMLPGFDSTQNLIAEFRDYAHENSSSDAIILFSCTGREVAIGPWMEGEIKGIHELWNLPLAGFFTYGEFGPDKNGNTEFFNLTCSLMLLSDNKQR